MNLLKRIYRTLFPPLPPSRYIRFQVQCKRCGEILEGRLDLYNDPSLDYEGETPVYFCRKVLVGSGRCYQPVEVTFKLDESRKVLERQIAGGEFVEE
jgi:hypothetical protein